MHILKKKICIVAQGQFCLQQYIEYGNEETAHNHNLHKLYGKINCPQQCRHAILLDTTISFQCQKTEINEECLPHFSSHSTETGFL